MGTFKLAAASVLDVVSATAVTISGTANLVHSTVTLGNNALNYQLDLQAVEQAVSKQDFASIAAEKAALARDERLMAIASRNMSSERSAAFSKHYEELLAVANTAIKASNTTS